MFLDQPPPPEAVKCATQRTVRSCCHQRNNHLRRPLHPRVKIPSIFVAPALLLLGPKCLPATLYGVDVCPLNKSQTESLQFAVNSSFMKIFNTKSMNVVSEFLDMFNVLSVADYIVERKCIFLTGYINSHNFLCNLLCRTCKERFKRYDAAVTFRPTHIACDIFVYFLVMFS